MNNQGDFKESDHSNEYQMAMMMKVKVKLKFIEHEELRLGRMNDRDEKLRESYEEILEL